MSHRIEKINDLIRKNINDIITREINLKSGVFVTIAKVDTTPDLRYTRIFVSVFPISERDYIMKSLEREMYSIQGSLNKKLHMKPLPRIEFHLDTTEEKADEIEKLLKDL